MADAGGLSGFATERGLSAEKPDELRELTPALLRGSRGGVPAIASGRLADGLEGTICHHVFAEGSRKRESTIVLCRLAESVGFIPALVCRDRATTGSANPAQLPAERWTRTELESLEFNRRYLLLTLAGQDPGLVRELFSPSLITWLQTAPPQGFSFELNEGNLTIALPGHLTDPAELGRLCGLAAAVAERVGSEIAEEEGAQADVFEDADRLADIERAMTKVQWTEPPASVRAAITAYRKKAFWSATVQIKGLMWGAIGLAAGAAIGFGIGSLVDLPFAGAAGAVTLGLFTAFIAWPLALLIAVSRHRWGSASVSRVGLESFVREYARSRELELENRWRFHAEYRHLTWPGFSDHVLAGKIPGGDGLEGRFVTLGDAAEMRSQGIEIVFFADRPLASSALLVRADRELPENAAEGMKVTDGYEVEIRGRDVLVWRPIQGNLLRTAAGSDRFCANAAGVVRELLDRAGASASMAR